MIKTNKSKGLHANISAILSSVGDEGHVLHLYTPNVNKYAIQTPFLTMAEKGDMVIYVTEDEPKSVMSKLKDLNAAITVVSPQNMNDLKTLEHNAQRIIIDAGSIEPKEVELKPKGLQTNNYLDHIERERHLNEIIGNYSVLCTYDVSKLNSNIIKQLVASHDKLILTTDDVTVLSSESFKESDVRNELAERFVKKHLEMVILALLISEPLCGIDIIKRINKNFNVLLSPGTIYPLLHKLEEKGLLECEYGIKTKIYRPIEDAKDEILDILNENVQTNILLSRFLQPVVISTRHQTKMLRKETQLK